MDWLGSLPRCLVIALFATTGCLPFLVPPVRVRAGVGAVHRDSAVGANQTASARTGSPDATLGEVSFGMHPLANVESHHEGAFDVGFGYRAEGVGGSRNLDWMAHGPLLEFGYYPLRGPGHRLGVFTELSALRLDGAIEQWRPGVTLGTSFELIGFSNGDFSATAEDGSAYGFAHGQWGIGLYAAGSYRALDERSHFQATLGISLRVPLLVGIVCCAFLDLSSGPSSIGTQSRKPEPTAHEQRRSPGPKRRLGRGSSSPALAERRSAPAREHRPARPTRRSPE